MNAVLEQYQRRVDELIGRGMHIPALPTQGAELLKITNQPIDRVDTRRVVDLVESEPTLTALLLRLANSARYGTARTIRRVDHAIFIVGLQEALGMLGYFLMRNMFPRWLNLPHFTIDDYWFHSWATAQTAQILGQPRFLVQSLPGELYIAGLLHDIGKAVLAVHLPEDSARAVDLATRVGIPLHEAERDVIGVDHAILGAAMLNKWMLPPGILDAVGFHHDPAQASPEHLELVTLVQLADVIADGIQKSLEPGDLRQRITGTWLWVEGRSPLVREDTLWPLIDEIKTRLAPRSPESMINESPVSEEPQREREVRRERHAYIGLKKSPPRRRGFWRRLGDWFVANFN